MKNIKKINIFMASFVVLTILIGISRFGNGAFAVDKAEGHGDVTTGAAIGVMSSGPDYNFVTASTNNDGEKLKISQGDNVDLRLWENFNHETLARMTLNVPGTDGRGRATTHNILNDELIWTTSDESIIELYEYENFILWNVKKSGQVTVTAVIKQEKLDEFEGLRMSVDFTEVSITFNVIDSQSVSDFEISLNAKESYTAGEYVNIEATAVNNTTEDKDVLLITALYDGNKMLVHSGSGNEVEAGESIKLNSGFLLPENSAGYKIKVFVWDKWYDPATSTGGNALSDVTEIEVR